MYSLITIILMLLIVSCSQEKTIAEEIGEVVEVNCDINSCDNDGVLNDCSCECPEGFIGETCENVDLTLSVQKLLDLGINPLTLLSAGVSIDDMNGKNFQNGLIFNIDNANKIVKTVVFKSNEQKLRWPDAVSFCENLDINGISDWYLPNLDELIEIRSLLYLKLDVDNFEDDYYWSSSTVETDQNEAYGVFFLNGNFGPIEKNRMNDVSLNYLRAVRKIEL